MFYFNDPAYLKITLHLLGSLAAGGVIGLERSYHGRAAGFRTHALVALASSLLMSLTLYQDHWLPQETLESFRGDPSRMAQGIMTGIGFLGAGVIYKEGLNVRGLTTAASIWITSAIGIMMGIGFYFPAILATVLVFVILGLFRWIEARMPSQAYYHYSVSYARGQAPDEESLRQMLREFGFHVANMTYHVGNEGRAYVYRMVIWTTLSRRASVLADALRKMEQVMEFSITPAGD
ncbi:MAG: MgtC/SapB family protein [Burkholderiaceae bacterium]|nr:MAG: MgtC/SapB family protein [Burkholderiaceae bacterium]